MKKFNNRRNNILDLFKEKESIDERLMNNISCKDEIISYLDRDADIKIGLMDTVKQISLYLKSNSSITTERANDIAREFVSVELFVFLAKKIINDDIFSLGYLELLYCCENKLIPESWDKRNLAKLNILFKEVYSPYEIRELFNKYAHVLPISYRLYSKSEDIRTYPPNSTQSNIVDNNNDLNDNNTSNGSHALSDNDIGKYHFDSITNNELTIHTLHRLSIYENLYYSNTIDGYKLKFKPFPNGDMDFNAFASLKNSSNRNNPNVDLGPINRLFMTTTRDAVHSFPMSEFISQREEKKKLRGNINLTFNPLQTAIELDNKLGLSPDDASSWVKRVQDIKINDIEWNNNISHISNNFDMNISFDELNHIVGMLGVGKSVFTNLLSYFCNKNDFIITHITQNKTVSKEILLNMHKIGVSASLIRGEFDADDFLLKQLEILNIEEEPLDVINSNLDMLRCFDTTSIVRNIYLSQTGLDYKSVPINSFDTLYAPNELYSTKVFANPEYCETDRYYYIEKLLNSNVWCINVDSLIDSHCPYVYDYLNRDFYTIIHKVSDIIICDEVDEIYLKSDDKFISDVLITTNLLHDSSQAAQDVVAKGLLYSDKCKYSNIETLGFKHLCNDVEISATQIYSLLDPTYHNEKFRVPFSLQTKIRDFVNSYFCTPNPNEEENILPLSYDLFSKIVYDLSSCIGSYDRKYNLSRCEDLIVSQSSIDIPLLKHLVGEIRALSVKDENAFGGILADDFHMLKSNTIFINEYLNKFGIKPYVGDIDDYSNIKARISLLVHNLVCTLAKKHTVSLNKSLVLNTVVENVETSSGHTQQIHNLVKSDFYRDFMFLIALASFDKKHSKLINEYGNYAKELRLENVDSLSVDFKSKPHLLCPKSVIDRQFQYEIKCEKSFSNNTDDFIYKILVKNYDVVGRDMILRYNEILSGLQETPVPPINIFLSATSYMKGSSKYHIQLKPNKIIQRSNLVKPNIEAVFTPAIYNDTIVQISGAGNIVEKQKNLKNMFIYYRNINLLDNELSRLQSIYEESQKTSEPFTQRQIIGVPCSSFEMAELTANEIRATHPHLKVICQYADNKYALGNKIEKIKDYHIIRDDVHSLCMLDCDVFVFVMSSAGRGLNILQKNSMFSLIGSLMFPARSYQHPDDDKWMIYAMHSIRDKYYNDSISLINDIFDSASINEKAAMSLKKATMKFNGRYQSLSSEDMFWNSMSNSSKEWMVMNFLVEIIQTIGRGLRGGTNLKIYLLDGSFVSSSTRNSYLSTNGTYYIKDETKNNSFLSLVEFRLRYNALDEVFNAINEPIVNAFSGLVLNPNIPFRHNNISGEVSIENSSNVINSQINI